MTIMSDKHHRHHHHHHHQIANRLPDELKRLVRLIMKTFYENIELYLVMDVLCTYPCIREEDLAELLKLETKHIKQNIADLKKEKFLSEKMKMQTTNPQANGADGGNGGPGRQTTQRIIYYYINYKMFVNVCKYKLDQMRINIENEETNRTNRASYCCSQCKREYSEFDMREIFRTMICIYCGGEVEEDKTSIQNRNGRNLLQKYNEKLEIIFELLRSIENIQLSEDLLAPSPLDVSYLYKRDESSGQAGAGRRANGSIGGIDSIQRWSGDATRHIDPFRGTNVNVNINEGESITSRSSIFDMKQQESSKVKPEPFVKQEPFIKKEPSSKIKHEIKDEFKDEPMDIYDSNRGLSTLLEKTKSSKQIKNELSSSIQTTQTTTTTTNSSSSLDDTILKLLLVHEKKTKQQQPEDHQQQQQQQQKNNHNHHHSNGLDIYDQSTTSSSSSIIIRKRDYSNMLHEDDALLHQTNGGSNGVNNTNHDYSIDSILKDTDNYNTTAIHKKRKLNGKCLNFVDYFLHLFTATNKRSCYYSDNNVNGYKNGYSNGYTNGHHHHNNNIKPPTVNGDHYMNGDLYNENDQHEQMDFDNSHLINGNNKLNGHHRLIDENVVDGIHHHRQQQHINGNGVNGHHHHHDTDEDMLLEEDVNFDESNKYSNNHDLLYKTKISNRLIDLDEVTPQIIDKMTKQEKELYVNKCRQLYMAMYEL